MDSNSAEHLRTDAMEVAQVVILIELGLLTQSAFACSNLTIETLEQGVKYRQS